MGVYRLVKFSLAYIKLRYVYRKPWGAPEYDVIQYIGSPRLKFQVDHMACATRISNPDGPLS
jgi:hypothetical protein